MSHKLDGDYQKTRNRHISQKQTKIQQSAYATTIQISHTTRSCPSSENLFISRRARRTPSADSNSQNPNPFGEPVVGSCARFQLLICPHSYTRDSQKKSEIQQ